MNAHCLSSTLQLSPRLGDRGVPPPVPFHDINERSSSSDDPGEGPVATPSLPHTQRLSLPRIEEHAQVLFEVCLYVVHAEAGAWICKAITSKQGVQFHEERQLEMTVTTIQADERTRFRRAVLGSCYFPVPSPETGETTPQASKSESPTDSFNVSQVASCPRRAPLIHAQFHGIAVGDDMVSPSLVESGRHAIIFILDLSKVAVEDDLKSYHLRIKEIGRLNPKRRPARFLVCTNQESSAWQREARVKLVTDWMREHQFFEETRLSCPLFLRGSDPHELFEVFADVCARLYCARRSHSSYDERMVMTGRSTARLHSRSDLDKKALVLNRTTALEKKAPRAADKDKDNDKEKDKEKRAASAPCSPGRFAPLAAPLVRISKSFRSH